MRPTRSGYEKRDKSVVFADCFERRLYGREFFILVFRIPHVDLYVKPKILVGALAIGLNQVRFDDIIVEHMLLRRKVYKNLFIKSQGRVNLGSNRYSGF